MARLDKKTYDEATKAGINPQTVSVIGSKHTKGELIVKVVQQQRELDRMKEELRIREHKLNFYRRVIDFVRKSSSPIVANGLQIALDFVLTEMRREVKPK
jgi:hypothetical protein